MTDIGIGSGDLRDMDLSRLIGAEYVRYGRYVKYQMDIWGSYTYNPSRPTPTAT